MRRPSITLRLTILFASTSAAVLVVVGLLIGSSVNSHFEEMDISELNGKFELITHAIRMTRSSRDLDSLPQRLADALVGHHALSVTVRDSAGRHIYVSGTPFPDTLLTAPVPQQIINHGNLLLWQEHDTTYRSAVMTVPSTLPGLTAFTVAVAIDIDHHQTFLMSIQRAIWIAVILGILLASALAWFMARRGLRPLHDIARVATGITAEHLQDRLPIATVPTELTDLATSFNAMLSRLEDSFRRLSEFSSDIAHELRTPISNLMMQTQVSLARARTTEQYREILYSNLEEYQHLARMISDMLLLAKADNGAILSKRESVDLAAQLLELFAFYEALAEEKQLRLELTGNTIITGDRLMLRRALSNLLSNAIRHTPAGGLIHVSIRSPQDNVIGISVANDGEPIPAEHLAHIFERFYRIDPSRQRSSEGAGLGLAITKSIAEAHGGRIEVSSGDNQTCFTLYLPAQMRHLPGQVPA